MKRFVFLIVAACSHHMVMQAPSTSAGTQYQCDQDGKECRTVGTTMPGSDNLSGTAYFPLPSPDQCKGGIAKIFVKNSGDDHPEVIVTCATAEHRGGIDGGAVETMGP